MSSADNNPISSGRLLLTVDQATVHLSLGKTKVYELLQSGELASVYIGTARRIPSAGLQAYVDRLVDQQSGDSI